jgi:hypothetical protein
VANRMFPFTLAMVLWLIVLEGPTERERLAESKVESCLTLAHRVFGDVFFHPPLHATRYN